MTTPLRIRILLVDDHYVVRMGLKAILSSDSELEVVGEAANAKEAAARVREFCPDIVLMDLRMPRLGGVESIRAIVTAYREARVVALTSYEGDADIYRALDAGACGYLIKDMLGTEVVGAIRVAASGKRVIPPSVAGRLVEFTPRVDLTPREIEVLRLAAKGLRNKDIARVIGRTEETVKVHLKHLMAKLGVADRTEAVTLALQRGIIHLDE